MPARMSGDISETTVALIAPKKPRRTASPNEHPVLAHKAGRILPVAADLHAYEQPARYWRDAPREVAEQRVDMIEPFYAGNEQLQRDEAIRSSGIADQTLMLAAKAMGYDSRPLIGFEPDKVGKLINLPADHIVSLMIAVGQATEPAWLKPGQLPLEEVVIRERF